MIYVRLAKRTMSGFIRHTLRALLYGVVGASIVLLVLAVRYLDNRQDLNVWHKAHLDEEYTRHSDIRTFQAYLDLEERLFTQLDTEVYDRVEDRDWRKLNRYSRGSLADPQQWPVNWNRSFELKASKPKIGVLLLHGMSDSPYSLRSIGQRLQREGAWVVGLRIPGHGTAPSGLLETSWQDMAAATRLAMLHLREKAAGAPLYIVGYSNGAALAVQYALSSLEDESLPTLDGLVLLSPEIGVSRLAVLAVWQERLGHLLGLEKLAWNSILPEYDAFKYGSFALNAGQQAYLLTSEIQQHITRLDSNDRLQAMPPILAFQSVVDATVSAPALIEGLFERLPGAQDELVIYDINRYSGIEPLLLHQPSAWLDTMLQGRDLAYGMTLLTNRNGDGRQVVARSRHPGSRAIEECSLDVKWPAGVYSLSHVALPFPPDDPLYGGIRNQDSSVLQLGNVALRGERGVLQVAASDLMRLRWNPFYDYQQERILDYLGLVEAGEQDCRPI